MSRRTSGSSRRRKGRAHDDIESDHPDRGRRDPGLRQALGRDLDLELGRRVIGGLSVGLVLDMPRKRVENLGRLIAGATAGGHEFDPRLVLLHIVDDLEIMLGDLVALPGLMRSPGCRSASA